MANSPSQRSDRQQAKRELDVTHDHDQPECCDPLMIETRVSAAAPTHIQR